MPVPLDLIRSHLRFLPGEMVEENAILEHYKSTAEEWVAAYCGIPFDDTDKLMVQAVLLLTAHSYENREPIAFSNPYMVPLSVHELLSPRKERVTGYVAPVEESE